MILQIKDAQGHKLGALALKSNNGLCYCTCQTTLSYHIIIEVHKMNTVYTKHADKVHMIQFNV
jgi:hypothetical protein